MDMTIKLGTRQYISSVCMPQRMPPFRAIYCRNVLLMRRLGSDAFDVALEPSEARLLLPFVLGLAGEFDNAAVQGAATNLFTVSSLHMLSWSPRIFCD